MILKVLICIKITEVKDFDQCYFFGSVKCFVEKGNIKGNVLTTTTDALEIFSYLA